MHLCSTVYEGGNRTGSILKAGLLLSIREESGLAWQREPPFASIHSSTPASKKGETTATQHKRSGFITDLSRAKGADLCLLLPKAVMGDSPG